MIERGVGSTADILVFTVIIVLSCTLLIGYSGPLCNEDKSAYANKVAQSTLLSFQHVPAEEFQTVCYTPEDMPFARPSERRLRRKKLTQLIMEDILLNPQWEVEGMSVGTAMNRPFWGELERLIMMSLEGYVGDRFGYKFTVKLYPIKISEDKVLRYRRSVCDYDSNSRRLCTESIELGFVVPDTWLKEGDKSLQVWHPTVEDFLGTENISYSLKRFVREFLSSSDSVSGKAGTVILTLELWSR